MLCNIIDALQNESRVPGSSESHKCAVCYTCRPRRRPSQLEGQCPSKCEEAAVGHWCDHQPGRGTKVLIAVGKPGQQQQAGIQQRPCISAVWYSQFEKQNTAVSYPSRGAMPAAPHFHTNMCEKQPGNDKVMSCRVQSVSGQALVNQALQAQVTCFKCPHSNSRDSPSPRLPHEYAVSIRVILKSQLHLPGEVVDTAGALLHEAAHHVPVVHVGSDQRHHSLRANQHAMQQKNVVDAVTCVW